MLSRSLRHKRASADAEAGFSMVETLIAMVVFALVASAGAAMLLTGIRSTRNSSYRVQASGVANELIEQIRSAASQKCAWLTPTPSTCQVPSVVPPATHMVPMPPGVTSTAFTATQRTEWEDKASAPSCSASGQGGSAGVQPVLAVTETVTWPRAISKPVTSQTILTPPVGAFNTNTGAITVHVENGPLLKQPVSQATVTVTDGSGTTSTYTTDDQGCAFVAYLAGGLYSVSVSRATYLSPQESAISTQSAVQVTSGAVTQATFDYDSSTNLSATFVAAPTWVSPPSPLPVAAGLPVTVLNPQIATNNGVYQLPNGSAGSAVYPYATDFNSGYNVWAGRCPDSNPDATNTSHTPLYPTGTGGLPNPTVVNAYAGQSVAAQVPLYRLTINRSGTRPTPVAFTFTETAGAATTACVGPFQTYVLGTSPAGSASYVVGVPLGTYTLTATPTTGAPTQTTVTVGTSGATTSVSM